MTEQTTTAVAATQTPREKLVAKYNALAADRSKIDEKMAAIVSEVSTLDALASVQAGTAVSLKVGKGDTAKIVDGVVLAVRDNAEGEREYKVGYGSGFDADVAIVKAGRFTIKPVEQAPTEGQPAA